MIARSGPAKAVEVANEFIRRALADGAAISHMKVQKLVYFAQGAALASLSTSLVAEPFEAWRFGPVIRPLYDALKRYGSGPITREICYGDGSLFPSLNEKDLSPATASFTAAELEIIDAVYGELASIPAFKLSAMTHEAGGPWDRVYCGGDGKSEFIPNEMLREYFTEVGSGG